MSKFNQKITAIHLDLAQQTYYVGGTWLTSGLIITEIIDSSNEYTDHMECKFQLKSNDILLQEIINCPVRIDYDLPERKE